MTPKSKASKRGKAVNMWLRDGDLERIRELAAFIAVEGYRVTDSAIIAAALRTAKPNTAFLKSFQEGLLLDGRRRVDE
jgi:hypothetical protein